MIGENAMADASVVKARKNNTFAVNLLSTVDRKHGLIDIDLIRKPNNHYCKMSGNGSHHL